jgi:hypothetical protein
MDVVTPISSNFLELKDGCPDEKCHGERRVFEQG